VVERAKRPTLLLEKKRYTYRDYLSFPDDGYTYQIIDGEVFMAPAPSPYHQRISRNIEFILWRFVSERGLGEVLDAPCDVVLSEENVVQPDLLFISRERLSIIGEASVNGPPDLVVEIISPSTETLDREVKRRLYERFGVKEYWVVDPERREIEIWLLREGRFELYGRFGPGQTLTSPVLKGLEFEVGEVF